MSGQRSDAVTDERHWREERLAESAGEEEQAGTPRTGLGERVDDPRPLVLGPWAHRFASPPPDILIDVTSAAGRSTAANEVAEHIRAELSRGRSLYCIVHDPYILRRLGGFDGRALPAHCLEGVH